jgi:hypothetical protein
MSARARRLAISPAVRLSVSGVDLTGEFVRIAETLTQRRLVGRSITGRECTDLPFEDMS